MRKVILICLFVNMIFISNAQWTQKNSIPVGRRSTFGSELNGKFYTGLGVVSDGSYSSDFWEFDITQNQWNMKKSFPGSGVYENTSFVINNRIYICLGFSNDHICQRGLWSYNPKEDSWTKMQDFPGTARYGARAFVIGDSAFVVGGSNNTKEYLSDMYVYIPSKNEWRKKSNFPNGGKAFATAFSINNIGYFGLGLSSGGSPSRDFWQYSPATDKWDSLPQFPGIQRNAPLNFIINNLAYVGFGGNTTSAIAYNDMYVFNPVTKSWVFNDSTSRKRTGGVSFAYNNKGYVGLGMEGTSIFSDILEFTQSSSTIGNNAHDCDKTILHDSFNSSNDWTFDGDGKVKIIDGKCLFNNVSNGSFNRVYKTIDTNLSNHWTAQCSYNIISKNPINHGSGIILLALTSNTKNFMTENNVETSQDGIAVTFGSASPVDNNINNWYFCIQTKKGNIRTPSSLKIYADSTIKSYYVQLKRESKTISKLFVYKDSTYSIQLSGSPITMEIDSTISGLNTIQHGVNQGGSSSRTNYAYIDNDLIVENNLCACNYTVLNNGFSTPEKWKSEGNGGVLIQSNKCIFNKVHEGNYNRVFQNLSSNLSNSQFKYECHFRVDSTNAVGQGYSAIITAFTAGVKNFMSENLIESNQNGIAVTFGTASPTDNKFSNCYFCMQSKAGVSRVPSKKLFVDRHRNNYYIRLERLQDSITLSVFTDSLFTQHVNGSPIVTAIDSTINNLSYIQHGVNEGGSSSRVINAVILNENLCQDNNFIKESIATQNSYLVEPEPFKIYPNPARSFFRIGELDKSKHYSINLCSIDGQVVLTTKTFGTDEKEVNTDNLQDGLFLVNVMSEDMSFTKKIWIKK